MNDDNLDGIPGLDGQNIPNPNLPDPGDDDIKISNTGQRIRAIAVGLIAVIGAAVAIFWFSNKQSEMKRHEDTKLAFQAAHAKGYTSFWKIAQIDVKSFKSNTDFEGKVQQIISDDPVRYGRYLKEKALPEISGAIPAYERIETPSAYAEQMSNVAKAAKNLRDSWNVFADALLAYDDFMDGKKKLDPAANAWLGAQQGGDAKYTTKAFGYFKLLECIMPDKKLEEIKIDEMDWAVQSSCDEPKQRSAWFRKVAFDCLPALTSKPGEADDAYTTTVTAARKAAINDFNSKFKVEDCLKLTRGYYEEELIAPLLGTWVGYIKAQNALLGAIKTEIDKLK